MSEMLDFAKNKYERGHTEDATACAAIAQAEALEQIAKSLKKLERLADAVEDVYDFGTRFMVRISREGE